MTNSADPEQLEEANWSGSTLFAKTGYILVQQDKGSVLCDQMKWLNHSIYDWTTHQRWCVHSILAIVLLRAIICLAEWIKMPCLFLIVSQSSYSIQIVDSNSNSEWQTVQTQISWLLKKPTDLDLHHLQMQGISMTIRTRVKNNGFLSLFLYYYFNPL